MLRSAPTARKERVGDEGTMPTSRPFAEDVAASRLGRLGRIQEMGAIFGAIGSISQAELREMGDRLSHRGAVATWKEVAPTVFLGRTAREKGRIHVKGALSAVIDLSGAAPQGVTEDDV